MTVFEKHAARTIKAPHDTVAGCRSRAEADLLASVSMLTANERTRMQISAASWTALALLLERSNQALEARKGATAERSLIC
jgi:hypothetical protein